MSRLRVQAQAKSKPGFLLSTQVKGVSNSVERRAYLDFILKAVQKG